MLKVYGFSKVNAVARGNTRDLRVLWALEELQLPFELAGLDHPAHELNTDDYRRFSPFEQIPAIDDDGLVLSESAAIVIYLARKCRRLIPSDLPGESQVLRWCLAAMNTVEPPLLGRMVLDWTSSPEECGRHREFMAGWVNRVLSNLERWVDGREFVATDEFSVADILMSHVLATGVKDEALAARFPAVMSYRDRCMDRPAWKRTIEAYFARVEAG